MHVDYITKWLYYFRRVIIIGYDATQSVEVWGGRECRSNTILHHV